LTDKKGLGLEFPNIPYIINGDTKITESIAVHQYIAEVWDQTLLGKTPQDKAKVNMLTSLLNEFRWKIIRLCYDQDDKPKPIELYKTFLPNMVEYLGKNDFLIGDYPTTIDFYFFETIQLLAMISDKAVFKEFKPLGAYHDRFM
jgi:glutathione S-transferase